MNHSVDEHGFAIEPALLTPQELSALKAALPKDVSAGRRGLLGVPAIASIARSSRLLDIVRPHLGGEPFPVRAIFFQKSPETNWLVAWHQDLTIAVQSRIDTSGFGPWTVKQEIPHVQPPASLLAGMLAVRLHIDDAVATNGALRVLPGTHCLGRLLPEEIASLCADSQPVLCAAAAGDALLMRPLLLHASSRSTSKRPRRVIHIEYAGFKLPGSLQWHDAA